MSTQRITRCDLEELLKDAVDFAFRGDLGAAYGAYWSVWRAAAFLGIDWPKPSEFIRWCEQALDELNGRRLGAVA